MNAQEVRVRWNNFRFLAQRSSRPTGPTGRQGEGWDKNESQNYVNLGLNQ